MTGFLRKTFGGKDAAEATKKAAQTSVDFQQQALDYLKEREAPLQFYQEQGLGGIASLLGLPQYGAEGDQGGTNILETLQQSPLYQGIMSGQQAGEEAILRNASATGGLRSGNVQSNLADFASQLQNQALTTAYQDRVNQLQGLSGLQSYAPSIASGTAGIGSTLASGITGAAQAQQNSIGTGLGAIGDLVSLFSDIRLKDNIVRIGSKNGFPWYSWDWNEEAKDLGLAGSSEGYMAHEVAEKRPDAVTEKEGYLAIYEDMLNG